MQVCVGRMPIIYVEYILAQRTSTHRSPVLPSTSSHALVQSFTPLAPTVGYARILRIQGYSDLTRVRPAVVRAAREMAELANTLAASRVSYARVGIAALDGGVATA
jgi:hypothetical protein